MANRNVVCAQEGCTERGVVKANPVLMLPGEPVVCGQCGTNCQQTDNPPTTPPPDWAVEMMARADATRAAQPQPKGNTP